MNWVKQILRDDTDFPKVLRGIAATQKLKVDPESGLILEGGNSPEVSDYLIPFCKVTFNGDIQVRENGELDCNAHRTSEFMASGDDYEPTSLSAEEALTVQCTQKGLLRSEEGVIIMFCKLPEVPAKNNVLVYAGNTLEDISDEGRLDHFVEASVWDHIINNYVERSGA